MIAAPPGAPAAAPESPYKLLDSFTDSDEDRRRFGGRDREIHDLEIRVTNRRTLVVYGPSGIGKTSLLRAGVFPALRERGCRPVYVRLLDSPVAELRGEVLKTCGLDDPGPGEALGDTLARAARAGPLALVLVLDQFEEALRPFPRPAGKAAGFPLGPGRGDPGPPARRHRGAQPAAGLPGEPRRTSGSGCPPTCWPTATSCRP